MADDGNNEVSSTAVDLTVSSVKRARTSEPSEPRLDHYDRGDAVHPRFKDIVSSSEISSQGSGGGDKSNSNCNSDGSHSNNCVTDGALSLTTSNRKRSSEEVSESGSFSSLQGFTVSKVLSNSADYKRVVVEGRYNQTPAVVILDKKPFSEEQLGTLFSDKSQLSLVFQNDIYGSYDCHTSPQITGKHNLTNYYAIFSSTP